MITEGFINSCFSIILCKSCSIRKDKSLYRDIKEIVEFSETKKTIEIPVVVQSKVDCLKSICKLKLDGREDDNLIDSVMASKKFEHLTNFIELKISEIISDTVMSDNMMQVRLRRKLNNLFKNVDDIEGLLTTVKNGNFDSIDDVVINYEKIVKSLYTSMMVEQKAVLVESAASLDLRKDDFAAVTQKIKDKYERLNTTPTGYSVFDNEILSGGFEPSRLYVFGGGSGSGKSTILNNFIDNAATMDLTQTMSPLEQDIINKEKTNVYIYVTMENTIEESFLRTYQDIFQKRSIEVLQDISNGINLKEEILKKLDKTNSTIIMKYFKPKSISCIDLMMVVDDVILEYGREAIRGLYVDYLDLLMTDSPNELYRIELGDITLGLKTIAVEYNIPVITLTQLGRSVYRVEQAFQLNLDQMGESIKKVEHADFIALLIKDQFTDGLVHLKVAKNRSGKANISAEFQVNFEWFKFLRGNKISNENKSDGVHNGSKGKKGPTGMVDAHAFSSISNMKF